MKKRWAPSDYVFVALLLAVGAFLVWKCRIGFGSSDETFYLTVPYRLYQGDALLTDEWHGAQMAAFLLLPLFRAYLAIFKSMDGILLAFRYLYTAVMLLFACFYYCRLRKFNGMAAAVAALSFCIFAPHAVMALSYNSMGIIGLLTAWVILATMERRRCLQTGIAGALFAVSVLCCPYLAVLYALYSLLALAFACWRRIQRKRLQSAPSFLLTGKAWGSLTVGIGLVAVAFFVFVLSRTTVAKIIEALPNILDDPEHPPETFKQKLGVYRWKLMHSNDFAPYTAAGTGTLGLALCLDRKRFSHKAIYLIAACLLTGLYLAPFLTVRKYINYLMLPINLLGLFAAFLTTDPRVKRLFCIGWLPGMAYTVCIHMCSNVGFGAIAQAATVATVASILMAGMAAAEALREENKAAGRIAVGCVTLLFAMQLGGQVLLRYTSVFHDGEWGGQTCLLTDGPEAGLYATEASGARYNALLADTECIRTDPDAKKVLYVSEENWYYLADDAEMAAYSGWLSGVSNSTMERLERYYDLNPDKLPDAVYVEKESEAQADWLCSRYGFQKTPTTLGFVLKK